MVLYKRKQVNFIRPPTLPDDLSTEVFIIPETNEWFFSYEDYMSRLDYYKHRKFVCEITGNSCLTFFEALDSEIKEIKGVERDFPESLREHILRFLQFNRITRLDQLVDKVYLVFKNDYFPGETIYIKGSMSSTAVGQTKQKGTIREKVQYNNPEDGKSSTKYLVVRLNDMRQAIVTQDKISRDRNHFTKWLIKTFIKLTMSRSHKVGAPWVVKDKYAKKYRIPQDFPDDLKHFEVFTPNGEIAWQEEKKKGRGRKKEVLDEDADPESEKKEKGKGKGRKGRKKTKTAAEGEDGDPTKTGAAAPKRKRGKKKEEETVKNDTPVAEVPKKKMLNFPNHYLPDILIKEHETALALAANQATSSTSSMTGSTSASASGVVPLSALQPTQRTIVDDLQLRFDLQRKKPTASVFTPPDNIKYWEENQGNKEITDYDEEAEFTEKDNVFPIQKALECWAFLNIYHKVLKLDTFTFDDFIYAIGWNSDQFNDIGNCELLDEMFCAVLGGIISNEVPSKKVSTTTSADGEVTISGLLITLPPKNIFQGKQPDQGDDDEDRGSDTENENEDNLLDKSDNESDSEKEKEKEMVKENEKENDNEKGKEDDENDDDNDDEDADADAEDEDELDAKDGDDDGEEFYGHNAYNVINYRNTPWYDRLRKRNFKDGNWQCIMMGVFSMVEYVPAFKSIIDIVYKTLAPIDESSRGNNNTTPTMVLNKFYEELNPSLRIQCLNLLITLLSGGKLVRSYIDECLDISTGLRRDRLDNIRDYKVCLEIIHQLNTQVQNKIDEVRKEKLEEKDKVKEEKDEKKEDDIVMDDGEVKKEEADEIAAEEKVEEEVEEGKIVDDMEVDSAGTTDMNTEQKPSIVSDSNGTKTKSEPEVTEPKRRTFVRINFNALEMTEEEREISLKDENFKQTWEKKREELIRIAELKRTKKDIELKLIEMDCQRVKLLGKDRFGNKYWWFENNGLPTLHGGSSGDDNDDDDEKDKENNDDDDIQKDDLLDETYLMGKLWIQGPSKEDVVGFLKSNEEEIQKIKSTFKNNENAKKSKKRATDEDYIKTQEDIDGFYEEVEKSQDYKEMDFSKYPPSFTKTVEELYGIKYLRKQIIDTKQVVEGEPEKALIFDRFGAIPKNDNWKFLTPIQRKLIEEASSPLLDNTEWRYYDKREDLDNLLSWMNPWGSRESLLRKELLVVKDAIYQSIDARRKALWLDRVPEKELEIEKQLSEIEEKLKADTAACKREKKKAAENKEKEGVQESVLEGGEEEVAEEESEVDSDDLDEVVVLPRGKRRAAAVAAETSMTMRKRQKASNTTTVSPPPVVLTPEQTIASGSVEDLENLQTELKEKLKETKKGRELARILEWVNLGAREELDRSLYEGGDKLKPRSKRQQPKR